LIDFLNDTTRAAMNLALNECLNRFPRLNIVLSHGGGFVPYAALRIARFPGVDENSVISQLQSMYFDTASVGGPYALPSLLAFARSERITFGSDAPFLPIEFSVQSSHGLEQFPMSDDQRYAIDRGNAEQLFPRLADQSEPAVASR
jgi:predicted TIM-barrel fold metal-dependent hydrolase